MAEGDGADDGVDQTVIAEDRLPQNGDGNGTAQNGRDVVDGTEQVHACDLEVQDVGDEQSEDQLQGHGDEGVLEGGDQRLGDLGIGEGGDVVHHAVLMDAVEEVHVGEAVVQRLTEGNGLEHDEADDPRDQVEQALPLIEELLGRGAPQRGALLSFIRESSFCGNSCVTNSARHTLETILSENCNQLLTKKGHRAYGRSMPLVCT